MSFIPVIGKSIKKQLEDREELYLSPFATLSKHSRGRMVEEEEDIGDIRLPFQRDRDRITHSKTFRRLKHKTQVFLAPTGDHYRTRLTHVLEVSQIARTIGAALCLNRVAVKFEVASRPGILKMDRFARGKDLVPLFFSRSGDVRREMVIETGPDQLLHG